MKIRIIFHAADWDGKLSGAIAHYWLRADHQDIEMVPWYFGNPPLHSPEENDQDYILDLPFDQVYGVKFEDGWIVKNGEQVQPLDRCNFSNVTWIDHHKSAIETHPQNIPGYRIDGVAACRLAWQWFAARASIMESPCPGCGAIEHAGKVQCEQGKPCPHCGGIHWGSSFCPYTEDTNKISSLPVLSEYINREVSEPLAVRLAGEQDVGDHRDQSAAFLNVGLTATPDPIYASLFAMGNDNYYTIQIIEKGKVIITYLDQVNAEICKSRVFQIVFENLTFFCVNSARFNSALFKNVDHPQFKHDALMGFCFDGKGWLVSLYHSEHRKDIDLSEIAKKYGGGGHRGACGFRCKELPFAL